MFFLFQSYDDSNITGETEIDIKGDTTFQCTLYAYSDEVSLNKINLIDNVDLSAIPVPDLNEVILSTAQEKLTGSGFVNIKSVAENDSIWEENNWIVVKQNLEAGTTAQKNEEIVLTCVKTKSFLEEKLNGLSAPEVKTGAEDLGFEVSFVNSIIDKSMEDRYSSMTEQEKEEWIAEEIEPASSGKREAQVMVVCVGDRQVPDVTGVSLYDALKTLRESDFSNIKYESTSGSSIWDTSNWQVVSQDTEAGKTIAANDEINLTVRSYKEIEEEQNNAGAANTGAETDGSGVIDNTSSTDIIEEESTDGDQNSGIDAITEDIDASETDTAAEEESEATTEENADSKTEGTEEAAAADQEEAEDAAQEEVSEEPAADQEVTEEVAISEETSEENSTPEQSETDEAAALDYEADMLEMLSAEQNIEAITTSFAEKYAGVEIAFDGNVAFVNDAGDAILVHSGSYNDEIIKGPDILLEGYQGDALKAGDQVSVTATVKTYDQVMKKFIVTPVNVSVSAHTDPITPDFTSNELIRIVQTRLNEEGFDCGATDGLAGQKTHSQVQAFKEARGLTVNDSIDAELLAYLHISQAVIEQAAPAPTPEPEPTKGATIVTQAPSKSLDEKLDRGYAWQALEAFGKAQYYPFDFKLHYIVGQIAAREYDNDTWFLKAECTIKDIYGNKYDTVCEGRVTGTTENPQVVYFFVYD